MDSKLQIFLDKIQLEEEYYPFFNGVTLKKILVKKEKKEWLVFFDLPTFFPAEVYFALENKKQFLTENKVTLIYQVEDKDVKPLLDSFSCVLDHLPDIALKERYLDALKEQDKKLCLVAGNKVEQIRLASLKPEIEKIYQSFGYDDEIPVIVQYDEKDVVQAIQKDLEIPKEFLEKKEEPVKVEPPKEKSYRRRKQTPDEGCLLGGKIEDTPLAISALQGEDNNVTVEGVVFGTEYFESSKSNFKIITLKLTDHTDSIYCKVFIRDDDEYLRLCSALK